MPKLSLFSFQKMNKYFLMPFAVPIICFSTKFFSETMKTDNNNRNIKEVSQDNTHTFVFLYQIIQSLCLFIGGLGHFIFFCSLKEKKPEIEEKNIEESEDNKSKENKNGDEVDDKIKDALCSINEDFNDNDANIEITDEEESDVDSNANSNEDFDANSDSFNRETYENTKRVKKNNKKKKKKNRDNSSFKYVTRNYPDNYTKFTKKSKKNILIIISMPLLFILYNLGIAYGVKHPQLEKRIYFLFFFTIINVFLFKKEIYSHQKLSLLITAIGIIPIFIAFGLFLDTNSYNIYYDIFLFIGSFGYSLFLVCVKYLTQNKGISVFLLLFYQGIFSFIYTLIIYIIISISIKGDCTYIYNIFHCNEDNYICTSHFTFNIIMYILFNTPLQTLIFFVVYIFSPEVFAISDIFSPLFSFISLCIQEHESNSAKIILTVLGYLIIAIAAFIYNEVIVCNFWGLNKNTWKAIDQKAYDEITEKDNRDSYLLEDINATILTNEEKNNNNKDE